MYSQHVGIKLRVVCGEKPGGGTTQLKNCPRRNCLQTVKGETWLKPQPRQLFGNISVGPEPGAHWLGYQNKKQFSRCWSLNFNPFQTCSLTEQCLSRVTFTMVTISDINHTNEAVGETNASFVPESGTSLGKDRIGNAQLVTVTHEWTEGVDPST